MVPPRNGKTETVLHFIARFIERNPDKTAGYVTYAQAQANSKARKIHHILLERGVKPGDIQTVAEWRTAQGGGLLATGVGGPLTGQGLDLLVIDDALKNREDADSPVIREKQWAWFDDVAETRLEPGASVVVLMTRWHEDDIVGRLIKNRPGEYEVIRIPALADGLDALGKAPAPDPLGRSIGEAIWPERRGGPELARRWFQKIARDKPHTFNALYQGLPRSKDDKLFPDAVFYQRLPSNLRYSGGLDLAYSKTTRSNFSAVCIIAWEFRPGVDPATGAPVMVPYGYIVYFERWKEQIGETRKKLVRLQTRFNFFFGVEANGPQKAIYELLRDGDETGKNRVKLVPLMPLQDKYARWQELSEMWKAGRIMLPDPHTTEHGIPTGWVNDYLEVMHNATGVNDPQDDDVDATDNARQMAPTPPPLHQQPPRASTPPARAEGAPASRQKRPNRRRM